MKIAVISPNKIHLNEIGKQLQAALHVAVLIEGGKDKMRQAAERDAPDLMLVDGMCGDPGDLAQIEYVTMHYPGIAVVLLCASSSPDFLISAMRAGVREVLPSPVTPHDLEAAVKRIANKLRGTEPRATGKVFAFIPCKGGSGATFLATSLGYQLAETKSVLLIDLNLQFGDALSFVHDAKPASTLADVTREIGRLDASFLAASTVKVAPNLSILAAPDDHTQAPDITPAQVEAVLALAVLHYDFVLLDVGRSIDTLSIKALDHANTIFAVMQAGVPSIRNAKKMLTIFKSLDYPAAKVQLIVNRFDKKGAIGIADIERALGKFKFHTVPNSYKQVTASIDHGDPLMTLARANPVSRNLAELARALSPQPAYRRSWFDRLLGRTAAPHPASGASHVVS
ncbi:MAG: Type secretion system ATPase TadZ/CpaE [Massilia sp.]|nr:Type secretion system ATPase TadZ/CpaE [Massilia sp.]